MATVAATTINGTMLVVFDSAGERGITIKPIGPSRDERLYVVEIEGFGFKRDPGRSPEVKVRANNAAQAVRRAAGAALLVYDPDDPADDIPLLTPR